MRRYVILLGLIAAGVVGGLAAQEAGVEASFEAVRRAMADRDFPTAERLALTFARDHAGTPRAEEAEVLALRARLALARHDDVVRLALGFLEAHDESPWREKVRFLLAEAHAAGLVHRDLKPANIFLHQHRHGETVKVVDFGLAKRVGMEHSSDDVTAAGQLAGTASYMAPERWHHEPYDGKSDIWSLGVILFLVWTGRLPFPSVAAMLAAAFVVSGPALPAEANDPPIYRTCKRLDKQIAHYQGVADTAHKRRDFRWWDASRAHVKRLQARRPKICPEQVAAEKRRYFLRGAQAARDAVKLASEVAIRYFTAGGWPF